MIATTILVTVRPEHADAYLSHLCACPDFRVTLAAGIPDAFERLTANEGHIDMLVLDNMLSDAYRAVNEVRRIYPRLLIVLVDEEADFAMPGWADDISTEPFVNDDLIRRIHRLMSNRHLETLRADIMPPVRDFTKRLRKAIGESEKQQTAVSTCLDLGYDYVAFYRLESLEPLRLIIQAQVGLKEAETRAPTEAGSEDVMAWVAQTGQSRIAGRGDEMSHPLVRDGLLGAVACAAVGTMNRYGVLVAGCAGQRAVSQQQMMLLELIGSQLAATISKE